jgi:hypothetical protein
MDGIDIYLTLVGFSGNFSGEERIVPVFPAIYGGYETGEDERKRGKRGGEDERIRGETEKMKSGEEERRRG